jgi:glycosyltransferase involved in cell wall biosynthesis
MSPVIPVQEKLSRRIAFILPNFRGGGAERVALTVIKDLLDIGHQVDLVLGRAEGELLRLLPSEVEVFDLGAERLRNMVLPLIRYFRDRRPHATQVRMWPLTVLAIIAHRLAGTPGRLVVSDHTTLSRQSGVSLRRLKWTVRLFYPLADARVIVSSDAAADVARLSGLPQRSFDVIYNPLPPRAPNSAAIHDPAWGGEGARILTVGSLIPVKNHRLLLEAFALVAKQREGCLIFLGDGECRRELEEYAAELGIADRVSFPGFALDPRPYYKSADVFVLSSDREGFGNVLVEAMSAGVNVVSTDCQSGPREILGGGAFGRLAAVGDARSLSSAILKSLDDPIDAEVLKRRAEELVGASLEAYRRVLLG